MFLWNTGDYTIEHSSKLKPCNVWFFEDPVLALLQMGHECVGNDDNHICELTSLFIIFNVISRGNYLCLFLNNHRPYGPYQNPMVHIIIPFINFNFSHISKNIMFVIFVANLIKCLLDIFLINKWIRLYL